MIDDMYNLSKLPRAPPSLQLHQQHLDDPSEVSQASSERAHELSTDISDDSSEDITTINNKFSNEIESYLNNIWTPGELEKYRNMCNQSIVNLDQFRQYYITYHNPNHPDSSTGDKQLVYKLVHQVCEEIHLHIVQTVQKLCDDVEDEFGIVISELPPQFSSPLFARAFASTSVEAGNHEHLPKFKDNKFTRNLVGDLFRLNTKFIHINNWEYKKILDNLVSVNSTTISIPTANMDARGLIDNSGWSFIGMALETAFNICSNDLMEFAFTVRKLRFIMIVD
ncbi:hypothetical protein H4219_003933 [Mycoemilia scoparia]|uniref:Uncharacterized protein n=1 Tax=Mycoemilia scoparia TaxID=417184 RepID=A0A9W8DSN4_9FUNG|nr:hypothetical protein H4219_003933 [Mycoemilia scoparia]